MALPLFNYRYRKYRQLKSAVFSDLDRQNKFSGRYKTSSYNVHFVRLYFGPSANITIERFWRTLWEKVLQSHQYIEQFAHPTKIFSERFAYPTIIEMSYQLDRQGEQIWKKYSTIELLIKKLTQYTVINCLLKKCRIDSKLYHNRNIVIVTIIKMSKYSIDEIS